MYGNPVPGIIAGPGQSAAAGQFRVTKTFAQYAPAGHGVDVANGRYGDPIFAMRSSMVSAVFNDTNGAKVSRALDSLRAALSEPQVDR